MKIPIPIFFLGTQLNSPHLRPESLGVELRSLMAVGKFVLKVNTWLKITVLVVEIQGSFWLSSLTVCTGSVSLVTVWPLQLRRSVTGEDLDYQEAGQQVNVAHSRHGRHPGQPQPQLHPEMSKIILFSVLELEVRARQTDRQWVARSPWCDQESVLLLEVN